MAVAPSEQELFDEHLFYECQMLVHTQQALLAAAWFHPIGNALMESFCFHARNLIEFFDGGPNVNFSLFAKPSFKPWASGRVRDVLVRKLNTHLAHLTPKRTSDPKRKIGEVERAELFAALSVEIGHLRAHLKPQFSRARLDEAVTPLPGFPAP